MKMRNQYDKYQVSLPRDIQLRIKELFDKYPAAAKDYRRGTKYGYVKFIEEAIRKHIEKREEYYMRRRVSVKEDIVMMEALGMHERVKELKKELGEILDEHSPKSKKEDS